jgi:hypothetical protein
MLLQGFMAIQTIGGAMIDVLLAMATRWIRNVWKYAREGLNFTMEITW